MSNMARCFLFLLDWSRHEGDHADLDSVRKELRDAAALIIAGDYPSH